MSMSQEEIEALMNGLDIDESESEDNEEASDDSNSTVNQEELDELVSSSNNEEHSAKEDSAPQDKQKHQQEEEPLKEAQSNEEEKEEEPTESKEDEKESSDSNEENEEVDNDDIDSLLKEFDNEEEYSSNEETSKEDDENNEMSDDDINSMLSQIDGVSDDDSSQKEDSSSEEKSSKQEPKKEEPKKQKPSLNEDDIVSNWTNTKINEGVIPLPADKDTKVVSQLNQVANDSEEKVSRIFDVLSLGLDNNNDFRTKITDIEKFLLTQEKLLESLNTKFPNIEIFKTHIAEAKKVNEGLESLKDSMNDEDMKIFEAMELMQFNDINRQKIERVMSVIRKLSLYLNNLFEDEYTEQEIAVAKHIHGDEAEDLIGEDLDKLIEEFGKNNN